MILSIQTETGGHLGFILFSNDTHATEGDCIIRALATSAALLDTDQYRHICHFRDAGECAYRTENGHALITITAPDGLQLRFERPALGELHLETSTGLKLRAELVIKE